MWVVSWGVVWQVRVVTDLGGRSVAIDLEDRIIWLESRGDPTETIADARAAIGCVSHRRSAGGGGRRQAEMARPAVRGRSRRLPRDA